MKRTRWKTWPVIILQQISNFRFEELREMPTMPCGLPKPLAYVAAPHARIREKSRAFFDTSAARRPIPVYTAGTRSLF